MSSDMTAHVDTVREAHAQGYGSAAWVRNAEEVAAAHQARDYDDWASHYDQAADSASYEPQRQSLEDTAAVLRRISADLRSRPRGVDRDLHQHRAVLPDTDEHALEL